LNLTLKDSLKYLILFLIGLLAVYLVFKGQSFHEIFVHLTKANYYWLTVSALLVLMAHWVRALRWQMLIQALGKPVLLKNAFYAVMVGYLANLAFPRLGEVTRCGVLKKKVDLDFTPLFGTVITERLVDLLSLLIVSLLTVALQFKLIFLFLKQLLSPLRFSTITIAVVIAAVLGVVFVSYTLVKKHQQHPSIIKITSFLIGLYTGLCSILVLKNRGLFILYTFLIWALYILSVYIAFWALPATCCLGIGAAFTVIVLGSLGMIAPVQGGMGAFHFMVAQALQFYSIHTTSGIALATLMHTSQTLIIIVIGFLSLFLILKTNTKPSNHVQATNYTT
jgi:glycosyltransferase 2 family protein